MKQISFFATSAVLSALLIVCSSAATPAKAAELRPETINAWNDYVASREKRIAAELKSSKGFLVMDSLNPREADAERSAVLAGEISVKRMDPAGGKSDFQIAGGTIHHWRGVVFIPDVPYEFAMHRIRHPELEKEMQKDVLESRVMERTSPDRYKLFLKLKRTQIITVVYNTEHLVNFSQTRGRQTFKQQRFRKNRRGGTVRRH